MPKKAKKTAALARQKPPLRRPKAPRAELVPQPSELDDGASAYARAVRAESTKRAYTTDFVAFSRWCEGQQLVPMPALPRTVALYLTALACT